MGKSPDKIDMQIIETLRLDGRTPNKSIAKRLSVSETTIASRIRAMTERNVMRVTLQRDIYSLGYEFQGFLDLYVAGRGVDGGADGRPRSRGAGRRCNRIRTARAVDGELREWRSSAGRKPGRGGVTRRRRSADLAARRRADRQQDKWAIRVDQDCHGRMHLRPPTPRRKTTERYAQTVYQCISLPLS